jgi:IMP dehydrogenase
VVDEVEIGVGKTGRRAYGLGSVAVVPSRRTRDKDDVDLSWELDAYRFALPFMTEATDAVVSMTTALEISALGGLAVLDLEGLWTRYEDPSPLLAALSSLPANALRARLAELHRAPIQRDLLVARIRELKDAGVVTCGALRPRHARELAPSLVEAELDLLVIRGTVVSAEHVSRGGDALNLKQFIRELDLPVVVGGCVSYPAALHLMRTGAVGVLVGVGAGAGSTTEEVLGLGVPLATAIADAAGARTRHLEETGVYVQVIAGGDLRRGGDLIKAIACGADAVVLGSALAAHPGAPAGGRYWLREQLHEDLPRGECRVVEPVGTLAEILRGPAPRGDGEANLFGALRSAMAACGYASVRELHRAEVVVG